MNHYEKTTILSTPMLLFFFKGKMEIIYVITQFFTFIFQKKSKITTNNETNQKYIFLMYLRHFRYFHHLLKKKI
jgi:hypothetical protein